MIYPYKCGCGNRFEIYKRVAEADDPETCETCGAVAERIRFPKSGHFYGASVEDAEYCPAMGCVVKNQKHRRQIAKDRGMVEVGNDSGKYFDDAEKDKEKASKKFYDELNNDLFL